MSGCTPPPSMTARVWREEPEEMLVSTHAASNWRGRGRRVREGVGVNGQNKVGLKECTRSMQIIRD